MWSPGLAAARLNILLSSVVGESLLAGRGLLMAGSTPPLPSGTPLRLSPAAFSNRPLPGGGGHTHTQLARLVAPTHGDLMLGELSP